MKKLLAISLIFLSSCATEVNVDPLDVYVEQAPTTVLDVPRISGANVSPGNRDEVDRGEYLVELLGCGACHTTGAIVGTPDFGAALSGSDIGIAFTTPLQHENPGVVYAPNITPDIETGIGGWGEDQIVDAFRRGEGRHGKNLSPVMPWPGYATLSDDDAYSIASYLQHLEPISHQVPDNVPQGEKADGRYVYFGIYEKK